MIWLDGNEYERLNNGISTGKLSATGMNFMIFGDDLNNGCHVSQDI